MISRSFETYLPSPLATLYRSLFYTSLYLALIAIADDGPGIPDLERSVLKGRAETALEHSQGLGLWLAQWTISLSDGSLSIDHREPRGSVVTLELPSDGHHTND